MTTQEQQTQIRQFLNECRNNGLVWEAAKLPSSHSLIRDNKISQIRGDRALAECRDELGNLTVLSMRGQVFQIIGEGELRQYFKGRMPFQEAK